MTKIQPSEIDDMGPLLRRAESGLISGLTVSIAAMAILAAILGGHALLTQITRLTFAEVIGLLGLSLVNYGARMIRWHIYSQHIGLRIPWHLNALYYLSGFAMTITPGKIGELLRLWLIRRGYGIRYERSASLQVADRLSDIGAMLILCLIGVTAFTGYAWAAAAVTLLMIGMIVSLLRPGLLIRLVGWLYARIGRAPRLFARIRTFLRHLERLGSWRTYGATLPLSLLGWFAEAVAFYWVLAVMNADVSLPQALFIFVFSMIAGAVALLPGGLGGTEVGMVTLLTVVGVGLETAVAATAVIRVTTLWFSVALGIAALPLALRSVNARRLGGFYTGEP